METNGVKKIIINEYVDIIIPTIDSLQPLSKANGAKYEFINEFPKLIIIAKQNVIFISFLIVIIFLKFLTVYLK